MLGVVGRLARRLAAAFHTVCGRIAFRCGGTACARRHFERVLSLGGDEFTSFVHLGRIALRDGDFAGYRREMANARACDPERYARLRPTVEGLEPRLPGTPFDETGERATWRSVRPTGNILRRTAVHSAEIPLEGLQPDAVDEMQHLHAEAHETDLAGREPARCDDFSSAAERDRFRARPPIRREDVSAADLDELLRRLSG
jgi:hypothetical protein